MEFISWVELMRAEGTEAANSYNGMDHSLSSVDEMRNDFQKADYQGKNPFAKGAPRTASNAFVQALSSSKARNIELHCWPHAQWTWTPFPKTLICLRRSDKLARDRISRTRVREAYLELLCEA